MISLRCLTTAHPAAVTPISELRGKLIHSDDDNRGRIQPTLATPIVLQDSLNIPDAP